jgi:hypothetical protein
MEDGTIFGDVDVLAPKHLISSLAQTGLVRELDKESQRVIGDSLFRVVEVDAFGLDPQSLAARRVFAKEGSQVR